ncbi:MAG: deoxyhypusine synthase [Candidatus Diapherotrites archaeon]|nr:deoxyhypusine synthase [Candidatus Diapherotrites archaeon]
MTKLDNPVKDIQLSENETVKSLMKQFSQGGGFTAKQLAEGSQIMQEMVDDKDCYKFLSFPACIMATGTRGIIKDLVKNKKVDAIITTGGTIDHDLARSWSDYYAGRFDLPDDELHKEGINRLGNVLVPNKCYGEVLEAKVQPLLKEIYDSGMKELATFELTRELGKRVNNENSVLHWAAKNDIPVFTPGVASASIGAQLLTFNQKHPDFKIDILKDEKELMGLVMQKPKSGALMIGGGISKHHTIWWNQFKDGLDYAVGITTAVEHDGSLSGARLKEAVSWGKINENAKYVTINGDATVLLPLLIGSLN